MYDPSFDSDIIDFEIGSLMGKVKKGFKKAGKALGKVTHATITKPSMMIGKAIGGKKGEAIGKKLGGFTAKVTQLGVGAGVAGAALPILTGPTAITAAHGLVAKKVLGSKAGKAAVKSVLGGSATVSAKPKASASTSVAAKAAANVAGAVRAQNQITASGFKPTDNALAAQVGALLVKQLGGPLAQANKALKLAELQRSATYEHRKLMADAEFRKKVLAGITAAAANGDAGCQRTIRVLVGR